MVGRRVHRVVEGGQRAVEGGQRILEGTPSKALERTYL
jgi:hypothetical protein